MRRVAINGKFLSAAPTGVHRVAAELIRSVDEELALRRAADRDSWTLLTPRDARLFTELQTIRKRQVGRFTWQPWEQLELPLYARGSVLLNLCNLGPLLGSSSIVMMHDAQVFSTPQSYSKSFRAWYRFAQPLLGRRALRVLTVSEFSRRELARYGIADADRISVVPNGCDHLLRVPPEAGVITKLQLKPRRYVVGLANTQEHKNVRLLLEAFRDVDDDLRLVLVGRPGLVEFEAAGLDVPPSVTFAGSVSDGELRALLSNALCLSFPSLTEGFGLPPLEAMALGCPAVVAPCGALPEVCGDAAIYCDPHDPSEWRQAIKKLANDPGEFAFVQGRGLKQSALFTWRQSAERLLSVLSETI